MAEEAAIELNQAAQHTSESNDSPNLAILVFN